MSLKHFCLLITFCILSVSSFAQAKERLTFSPGKPVAGQSINLTYTPLPGMEKANQIKAHIYSFNHFEWNTYEINLTKENDVWSGNYTIPINSGLLIFKFVGNGITDNNNNMGFACMVFGNDGKSIPGAYAGWGLFRSNKYGYDIPDYVNLDKYGVSDTVVHYWLQLEVERCRASNVPMSYMYVATMKGANTPDIESKTNRVMNFLLKDGSEDALINAMRIAMSDNKKTLSDSISDAIVKKYPQGKWAFKKRFDAISMVSDMNTKRSEMENMLESFTRTDELESFLQAYGRNYDDLYSNILLIDAVNKHFDGIQKYIPQMSFGGVISMFYRLVEVPHLRKDIPDSVLIKYADIMVDRLEKIKPIRPINYKFLSDEEWESKFDKLLADNVYIYYVDMLKNLGNYSKALDYAYKAQNALEYKSAPLNEDMAFLLNKAGKEDDLQTLLQKSLFTNQTSDTMMAMFKADYYKKHNSYDGYDKYVESFKNPADKSAMLESIKEYKRSGKMPAWRMTDANGNTVTSEQMKGKVYVLDFWASWCVPCKASFPGMKMAVEHFKDDKNVKFYFVDTQEMVQGYQKTAVDYLKKNNFPFNLLFDGKVGGSKINDEYVKQIESHYTISGIPLKIIVDGNGDIQYIAIGYKGSPSGLADELIEMIEQTKNFK